MGTNKERFRVTYKVLVHSDKPSKLFISYKDSTDYVTLYTDKSWSKDVCLPSDGLASLLVVPQYVYDVDILNNSNNSDVLFSGQIIHEQKIVSSSGKQTIIITLLASDI